LLAQALLFGLEGPEARDTQQGGSSLAILHQSSDVSGDAPGHAATRTAELLAELSPNSDLVWLVDRVSRAKLPWVVIPGAAITAWEGRDPAGWAKVSEWLDAGGVTVVQI